MVLVLVVPPGAPRRQQQGASAADLPELHAFVRPDPVPSSATVVVRGCPDSLAKIESHALRTARAYVLDGEPALGISVFAALDDIGPASLEGVLAGRLSTYRVVHLTTAGELRNAGFVLLPTFGRPHVTLLLGQLDRAEVLLKIIGPPQTNPQYGETRRRPRR